MLDKINFMETLRSVAEIAKTSANPLSREEINQYFENMDLSKEQQEMVYQYLLNPEVESTNTEVVDSETIDQTQENSKQKNSPFDVYLEEIKELPKYLIGQEEDLYAKLQQGDESVISKIVDLWLEKVISMAKEYASRNVNMEDVVQEGNLGLLFGLQELLGMKDVIDVPGFLTSSIKESMEQFIDESVDDDDWENTVLAKATLIYEAQKALALDLQRVPTREELCEYTKLSNEEITDILSLSKDLSNGNRN